MTLSQRLSRTCSAMHGLRSSLAGLMASTLLLACSQDDRVQASPPEKVTVAVATIIDAALVQVAYEKGFMAGEGLDVSMLRHPYGKLALEDMIAGRADLAIVAETPVMCAVMSGVDVTILATIQSAQNDNAIVARKDRGIHSARDLRGKRIGTTKGTTSDYFLNSFLAMHRINRGEVDMVDVSSERMAHALASGKVDAIASFSTYAVPARKKLAEKAIVFEDGHIYTSSFHVTAKREFIRDNPRKVERLLQAIVRAEEYARSHREEAQRIVAGFSRLDLEHVKEVWGRHKFEVALDQSLLLALEDESRWAIKSNLCRAKAVPNYLDSIYLDGLRSVRPDAVRILR